MSPSKHDIHPFDTCLKSLGNQIVVIVFATAMGLLGVMLSIIKTEWLWFSRFGSLITISGLLLMSSPSFVKGIYRSNASATIPGELDEGGKPMETNEIDRKVGNNILTGIVITIIGTVIWGFGDLIGKLF